MNHPPLSILEEDEEVTSPATTSTPRRRKRIRKTTNLQNRFLETTTSNESTIFKRTKTICPMVCGNETIHRKNVVLATLWRYQNK